MEKGTTLHNLQMSCPDNPGHKINYMLKTKNTDSARSAYDDYRHEHKEEVFTDDEKAFARYKELAAMRHKKTA